MEFLLNIIGVVVIVFSIIVGILASGMNFIIMLVLGFVVSMIFFALSRIIENQNTLIGMLNYQYSQDLKTRNTEKKTCTKCNKEYDPDYTSCPHCGYRD